MIWRGFRTFGIFTEDHWFTMNVLVDVRHRVTPRRERGRSYSKSSTKTRVVVAEMANRLTGAQRTGTRRFKGPNPRQRMLADSYVNQGKTFKAALIDAGYSPKLAKAGPTWMRRHSVGIDTAFVEAARQHVWKPEEVKACIRSRLLSDVTNGKSSGVERACELLGKDKEIDMWVRTGDVQVGIFAGLFEDSKLLTELVANLPPETDDSPKD
jgi:hypothetical protein